MKPAFFYIVVLVLCLVSAGFGYEYRGYTKIVEDQAQINASIISTDQESENDRTSEAAVLQNEQQNTEYVSYGYLAGAVFFAGAPIVMLMYRRKIVS